MVFILRFIKNTLIVPDFNRLVERTIANDAAHEDMRSGDLDLSVTEAKRSVPGMRPASTTGTVTSRPAADCDHCSVYRMCFKLEGFAQSEIQVTLRDRRLTVTAERNEAGDDFVDVRKFCQTVIVPDDVILEDMTSRLFDDGVLEVSGPLLMLQKSESGEGNVVIQQQ